MDAAKWPQGIGFVKVPMEDTKPIIEKKARPQKDQALNCPRCSSTNTKFCYYNNYSLSQPRYFCKTCRRYWTEGGTLRNVPVGGGSRKNKRSSTTTPPPPTLIPPSSSNKKLPNDISSTTSSGFLLSLASQNPKNIHQGQDLNLAYPTCDQDYTALSKFIEVPYTNESNNQNPIGNSSTSSPMELLKGGMTSRELGSFMSIPVPNTSTIYSTGLPSLPPSSSLFMEGLGSGYGSGSIDQGVQETSARLLFPLEELKSQGSSQSNAGFDQNRSGHQGFWSGVLGGGTW